VRILILAAAIIFLGSVAYAQIAGTGGGNTPLGPTFGRYQNDFGMGLSGASGTSGGGGGGSDLLLESGGSNFLLLEDGSSKLCLESGC
jgi:hypothetical protein